MSAIALLLDAAAQNGVNSSTFSVASWWVQEVAVGFSVGLLCEKKMRAISGESI